MVIQTPAKINITLDIIGKRENGYHDVKMIMQKVSLFDIIEIEKANSISIETNLPYLPCDRRNIVYRASEAFFEHTGIIGGAKIKMQRSIPVGAGLAGGSTNAAGVLMALDEMYGTQLSKEILFKLGSKLGADVAFFIDGSSTCLAEGLGEVLTPITPNNLKGYIVLAKPNFPVSTKWVYESLKLDRIMQRPNTELVIEAIKNGDLKTVAENMVNVLETVTIDRYPEIERYKKNMLRCGAIGSIMSGSGSTAFGIFDDKVKASACADEMKRKTDDVFLVEFTQ